MTDSQMNEAWQDNHLTEEQLAWMQAEGELLRQLLETRSPGTVVDCGCGSARIIEAIDGSFLRFVGIDIQEATVRSTRERLASRSDVSIIGPRDFRDALPEAVAAQGIEFSVAINTGNTLGVMAHPPESYVRAMGANASAVFISVCRRGAVEVMARLGYYRKNGLNCSVDWRTNTITSDMWGPSRAWDEKSLRVTAASLQTLGFGKPEIFQVDPIGIALWATRD